MAGTKRNTDSKLVRKFISSLGKELVNDSESGFDLAQNTEILKDALQKSVVSLPSGKLRSSLQLILEHESQQETFISSLQNEIRALSAKLELHSDVLLTPTASDRLFETLVNCIHGKTASSTYATDTHVFSDEEIQILLARHPAPHILWALAAVKFAYADGANGADAPLKSFSTPISASASTLLCCLKPWVVDRDSSVAIATMAPLVPLIFESVQQASRDIGNMRTLRTLVKEVLSFIVAVNYKGSFIKGSAKIDSRETLSLSALLDGFLAVFKAFGLQGPRTPTETSAITEKLSCMFPLASELIKDNLEHPDVGIGRLADIVKSEFLLLYMVLEVLYWRQKSKDGGKLKTHTGNLTEQVGRIAVDGVAAGQTDLILDILLSDLSTLDNLLDEDGNSLVCISIFKALLLNSTGILDKKGNKALSRSRKALEGFVKRIAVARKIAIQQGTKCDVLDKMADYLQVPSRLVEVLRSCKLQTDLLEKETVNKRALIGWLLQLDNIAFQTLVSRTRLADLRADDHSSPEKVAAGNAKSCLSSEEARDQAEAEDLFFVDTTGEEQGQDTPGATRQSKKSKKRKAKRVLYHRQGRVTNVKEQVELSERVSGSSDSDDEKSGARGKRRNGEEQLLPVHGTVDD